MKKKRLIIIIFMIVIIIVLFKSMSFLESEKNEHGSLVTDVTESVKINKKDLNVKYLKGNMFDETITFGNKIEKYIVLDNKNNETISYAISLKESVISNDKVVFNLYASNEEDGKYTEVLKNNPVKKDGIIGYNLGIAEKSKLYLKLEFIANMEGKTEFKGKISITTNLTEKEIFNENLISINNALENKINSLNGINVAGFYILELKELSLTDIEGYYGYILIDARDISSLSYYYTIYNNKYLIKHWKYNKDSKPTFINYDRNVINNLNFDTICSDHTKKECLPFSNVKYSSIGGKNNFLTSVNDVIKKTQEKFNKKEKQVYVYDVKVDLDNFTNVRGFILVNNKGDRPEYYLYLTNNLFMVSGYNLTKYGEIKVNSSTIRAYNETAFSLSSATKQTACSFSGFNECYDSNGQKV